MSWLKQTLLPLPPVLRRGPTGLLVALLQFMMVLPVIGQSVTPLTDQEFRDLIFGISEPAGVFTSENLTSNEAGMGWIIPELTRRAPRGGAYLGVGPEQNFSYIAATSPKLALILDIRRQAMVQQLFYKALFELAPDRASFLSLLFGRPLPQRPYDQASVATLFASIEEISRNDAFFEETLEAVIRRLTEDHQLPLTPSDLQLLRRTAQITYLVGPRLEYSSGTEFGRGRILNEGVSSRIVASYSPKPTGGRDTVRSLLTTLQDGSVDTIVVRPDPPGNRPSQVSLLSDTSSLSAALLRQLQGWQPPEEPLVSSEPRTFRGQLQQTDSLGQPQSFLAGEEQYRRVRELQLANLIIPVVGNFAGPQALREIGNLLRRRGESVSTFYLSNVEEYLFYDGTWRDFYRNVAALPLSDSTLFVRSFLGGGATLPHRPGRPRVDLVLDLARPLLLRVEAGKITSYADLLPSIDRR